MKVSWTVLRLYVTECQHARCHRSPMTPCVMQGIEGCFTLKSLDLRGNQLGTRPAAAALERITSNRTRRMATRLAEEEAEAVYLADLERHSASVRARKAAALEGKSDSDVDMPAIAARPDGPESPSAYFDAMLERVRTTMPLLVLVEPPTGHDRLPTHLAGMGSSLHQAYTQRASAPRQHGRRKRR